jgi:hypothetical protein
MDERFASISTKLVVVKRNIVISLMHVSDALASIHSFQNCKFKGGAKHPAAAES